MSAQRKTIVGVIFGGRSVEHDVSVVTGHQIMQAFDPARYDVVPVYIDREGRWLTGAPLLDLKNFQKDVAALPGVERTLLSPGTQHHGLIVNPTPSRLFSRPKVQRLDVVFPAIHGSHGEDGTLQGLFELADIAYAGCGVLASAIANHKQMTKSVLRQAGVPVVDSISFTRAEWDHDPDSIVHRINTAFPFPVFIKPATLGSSIGIGKADSETLLRAHVDVAASLDSQIIVEQAVVAAVEINCSVLGNSPDVRASVLEQPVSWDEFLTYEEKYMRGGEGMKSADRVIPAPIDADLTAQVQDVARRAFVAIGGRGIARIDFLLRPETREIFLNEINTLPGSLSFYLWQEEGITPRDLVHQLVELGREAQADKRRNSYNYKTGLIDLTASRGLKGTKGTKKGI